MNDQPKSNFKPVGDGKEAYIYMVPRLEDVTGTCQMCGNTDELRPYGPNGESVCFDCAMKDEPAARRQFEKNFQ